MVSNPTSWNKTLKWDPNEFPWEFEMNEQKLTLMEKIFCLSTTETVLIWIIFSIELFVMCLALYGLFCLYKSNQSVPIFVVNLFVSDLLQICIRPLFNFCTISVFIVVSYYIYSMSMMASIEFMVCISLERYIMIKHPVWYRQHNTSKKCLWVCCFAWALTLAFLVVDVTIALTGELESIFILSILLFLFPYPVVVFCCVGSWRAISKSVSISPNEKKRIIGILALVLFNYTALFLPSIIQSSIFSLSIRYSKSFNCLSAVSGILVYLNPLTDTLLYVFLRKDAYSKLSCFSCLCCVQYKQDNQIHSLRDELQTNSVHIYTETTLA